MQKLLTHKDDNVYMYITVLVLFPGPSTLPIWRLGTGITGIICTCNTDSVLSVLRLNESYLRLLR